MMRVPEPNEIYRHFKGNLYRIITLAEHMETGERLVVYQALYGDYQVYARPLESFQSRVDHVKYPDVQEEYRFTLLPPVPLSGGSSHSLKPSTGGELPQGFPFCGSPKPEAEPEPDARQTSAAVPESAASVSASPAAAGGRIGEESLQPRQEEAEFVLDPRLADFLDADTYREKLEIFAAMHDTVTDDMLNTLAVSLDLELEPGELEERYQTLKNCLFTLEKYECSRLR